VELAADRLADLLGRMRGRRIAVVGDAILDRYLVGDSQRLSPEAPVPVVTVSERRASPGGAANVAANLAALGAVPLLVAVVGDDTDGALLRHVSREAGFGAEGLLSVNERPTTVKTRVIARGQQVVRIDEEDAGMLDPADAERLLSAARVAIESADAVILEDYDKGVLTPATIPQLMAAAQARPIPIVVDPRYQHFFAYRGATVFKPNRRELATALGPGVDLGSTDVLRAAVARLGVEHLLLTLGGEGMVLVGADGRSDRIPARAREVFDVSGAGDTVAAWCAAALGAGATVLEAAAVANLAAGVEVGKAGVATVAPEEVLAVD
jgi:D-beta-D-heptose 7-phosphate kinase/D-beta-D-heptose 1-phosphate adenosyltransferase